MDDQSASRMEFEDGTVITKCERCQQIYAERTPPGDPPCETCRVDLMQENVDTAKIFGIVRGQVLTRHNGQMDVIMGLNHLAVWAAIDAYGVKDRTKTFERVISCFEAMRKK